jgi:hypothetical protein
MEIPLKIKYELRNSNSIEHFSSTVFSKKLPLLINF